VTVWYLGQFGSSRHRVLGSPQLPATRRVASCRLSTAPYQSQVGCQRHPRHNDDRGAGGGPGVEAPTLCLSWWSRRDPLHILNGSKHADNSVDLQKFVVMPVGAPTFVDALDICGRSSESPVISSGFGRPMRSNSVGETSASRPAVSVASPPPISSTGTGFVVCDVCGPLKHVSVGVNRRDSQRLNDERVFRH
jgi:hypothetical protein